MLETLERIYAFTGGLFIDRVFSSHLSVEDITIATERAIENVNRKNETNKIVQEHNDRNINDCEYVDKKIEINGVSYDAKVACKKTIQAVYLDRGLGGITRGHTKYSVIIENGSRNLIDSLQNSICEIDGKKLVVDGFRHHCSTSEVFTIRLELVGE